MRSFYRDLELRKCDNVSPKWLGGIATGQRACGLQPPHQDLAWWDVTDKVGTKNIKYEWITNNLTKCTRCMSTVHLTLNQNQSISIRITLHSRYNHICKIWTSAWTSIYLNYSINNTKNMYENNVKTNTTNKLLMLQQTEAVGVI